MSGIRSEFNSITSLSKNGFWFPASLQTAVRVYEYPSLVHRQIVCYFSAVKGNFVNIAPGNKTNKNINEQYLWLTNYLPSRIPKTLWNRTLTP
jgi:hypothetical protein